MTRAATSSANIKSNQYSAHEDMATVKRRQWAIVFAMMLAKDKAVWSLSCAAGEGGG